MRTTLLSLLGNKERAPLCGVENLEFEDQPVPASSLEVPEEPSTTSHAVEMDACSGGARGLYHLLQVNI
ncbi:hypothetical protein NC651_000981 [Populus alba x Populus x berolinensis]|nr:hypothetical protein NC651_000981 [Populus alba x Populus x berolinensis]